MGCFGFWLIGYGLAYGRTTAFIGTDPNYFAASGFEDVPEDNYVLFMFQAGLSISSVSMISGCMAERAKLPQQIFYSFL